MYICIHVHISGGKRCFKVRVQRSIFQVSALPERTALWHVLGTQSRNSFQALFSVFNTESFIKAKNLLAVCCHLEIPGFFFS